MIDVDEAMRPDAPILHDDMITDGRRADAEEALQHRARASSSAAATSRRALPRPTSSSSAASRPRRRTRATSSRMPASPASAPDGQGELWCCTQGQFMVRDTCAALLGMDMSELRVTASEIGGGFGGKTTVYLEPVALALSRKAGRPVKMVMSRDEVFRATGPTSGTSIDVKIGAKKDGTLAAGEAELTLRGRRLPGLAGGARRDVAPSPATTSTNVHVDRLRRRASTSRRWRPIARPARRCRPSRSRASIDELAEKLGMDPIELRLKNAVKEGDHASYGPTFGPIGFVETLEAAQGASALQGAARARTRGAASPAASGSTSAARPASSLNVNDDGTVAARRPARPTSAARARRWPDGGRGARHSLRQGAPHRRRHRARSATTT